MFGVSWGSFLGCHFWGGPVFEVSFLFQDLIREVSGLFLGLGACDDWEMGGMGGGGWEAGCDLPLEGRRGPEHESSMQWNPPNSASSVLPHSSYTK